MNSTTMSLSVTEAARILNVSLNYTYSLLKLGKLSATKQDGRWQVSREGVLQRMRSSHNE